MDPQSALKRFLGSNPGFKRVANNKVKCGLTGHEMLADVEVIKQHMSGKKYLNAQKWYSHDFGKYKAYYIYEGKEPKTMFCQVTKLVLNKIPDQIERHISGRKYKVAKIAYEKQLDRTKQANLKRDERMKLAKSGFNKSVPTKPVAKPQEQKEEIEVPKDAVDFNFFSQIDAKSRKNLDNDENEDDENEDDMADLNPALRRLQDEDDEEEMEEDDMEEEDEDDEEMDEDEDDEDEESMELDSEEELMNFDPSGRVDNMKDLRAPRKYDVTSTYAHIFDLHEQLGGTKHSAKNTKQDSITKDKKKSKDKSSKDKSKDKSSKNKSSKNKSSKVDSIKDKSLKKDSSSSKDKSPSKEKSSRSKDPKKSEVVDAVAKLVQQQADGAKKMSWDQLAQPERKSLKQQSKETTQKILSKKSKK